MNLPPLEISERFKRRVLVQFWDKDIEKYLEDIKEVLDGVDEKTKGNIIAKEVYEYFNE